MSLHPDFSSSSQPVRKRKHSDDPATAIASGASTPGHHASPPSHSPSNSSTPPSSLPSMSASPCTAKPLDDDDPEHGLSDAEQERGPAQVRDGGVLDHHLKRSKVYDLEYLDENGDHPIVIADDEYGNDQVYYDNNGAYSGGRLDDRLYDDVTSNQADDEDSIVEVYGGSPGPSNSSSSFGDATVRRAASPAASHASGDSDTTITPNRIRLAESQARASDSRLESSTASRPRSSATPTTSLEQERAAHRTPTRVNDPNVEEVIEVIDLTRPERRTNYPRGDSLPRVPGLSPQHSFNLPTLQRLVSRSSESMERSQPRRANNSNSSIDVHEIPDDDDEAENDQDDDRFGSNTVRIDSDVHEVQLDPHHPWARGPIQLILSPERSEEDQYLEGQRQRQLEDAIVVDDHLTQIDYEDIESDSELEDLQVQENAEVEDDGVTAQQVDQEVNWILNLRRAGIMSPPRGTPRREPSSRGHTPYRSPSFEARRYSFEARPSPFPTAPRRSATPGSRHHRFSPVARHPSPVPLILRTPSQPRSPPPRSSTQSFASAFASGVSTLVASTTASASPKTHKCQHGTVEAEDISESWARQNLRCSICMEVMVVPTMVRCGHAFCRECILRALDLAKICPMCRFPTTKNKLQELEFFKGSAAIPNADPVEGGSRSTMDGNGVGVLIGGNDKKT
ncbi:hypothetical protein EDD21DRAFT_393229 [Dissophora ornata]|nr:hypothetical protein EDD21DRAFT_393229 [Dissophora ornata]